MADWLHQPRPNVKAIKPAIKVKFRDIDCDYRMTSKHNSLLVDDDLAIRTQIKNLLGTPIGSEDFEPTYGSNLPFRIDEPISDTTAFLLETDTIIAISTWLADRVQLIMPGAVIQVLDSEDGYNIQLPYVNLLNNNAQLFSFDVLR